MPMGLWWGWASMVYSFAVMRVSSSFVMSLILITFVPICISVMPFSVRRIVLSGIPSVTPLLISSKPFLPMRTIKWVCWDMRLLFLHLVITILSWLIASWMRVSVISWRAITSSFVHLISPSISNRWVLWIIYMISIISWKSLPPPPLL